MLRRRIIFTLFIFLIFLNFNGFAQSSTKITIHSEEQDLSQVLNSISTRYSLRFAFNDDVFSQIKVNISYENASIDIFLDDICKKYGLRQKLIGGTYVFYIDDEAKLISAINAQKLKIDIDTVSVEKLEPILPQIAEYHIGGVVINAKTREKLSFCRLTFGDDVSVTTNNLGFFTVDVKCDGKIPFTARQLGFNRLDTIMRLGNGGLVQVALEPILFVDSKNKYQDIRFLVSMENVPGLIKFSPSATLQIPGVESNDLMNAFTIIPGVNFLKGTDTGLSIRGGAPSDNLVLIDDIPMMETSHLMGNLSVLNAKYIQQAFVSRGGFGAEYGGRTSGIVDLTGKNGNNIVPIIDFTANLLHANIYVGLPINKKVSLSGAFKKSFVDIWSDYLINNFALENMKMQFDGEDETEAQVAKTFVNYNDANVKLSIRPTNRNEITFNFFNSADKQQRNYSYDIDGDYFQNNYSDYNVEGYSVSYVNQRRNGWCNKLAIGYSNLSSSSEQLYSKKQEYSDQILKSFYDTEDINIKELRACWKAELEKKVVKQKFGLGFNYNSLNNMYQDREVIVTGANNFIDSISTFSNASFFNAYYQIHLLPIKGLALRAGGRSLYNLHSHKFYFQPRYGIEIIPSPKFKFYYSGGSYLQYLYLAYRIDTYTNASSIWYIPENENEYLQAFHHVVGTLLNLDDFFLNIEAYRKSNSNKAFFIGDMYTTGDLNLVNYEKYVGQELNQGIDLFLQWRTKMFKHLVSYSISESYEKVPAFNTNEYFPSVDYQLHRLRFTETVDYHGWTASVNWYYASGAPYLMSSSTTETLNFGQHNDFMQLDLALVKHFNMQNFYADIGITLLNVFNKQNELQTKNIYMREGMSTHSFSSIKIATSFSPLFYINFRYE